MDGDVKAEARGDLGAEDAAQYRARVQETFADDPETVSEFMSIMREFRTQSLDTEGVMRRIAHLFSGHSDLVAGFNQFLPPSHYFTVLPDGSFELHAPPESDAKRHAQGEPQWGPADKRPKFTAGDESERRHIAGSGNIHPTPTPTASQSAGAMGAASEGIAPARPPPGIRPGKPLVGPPMSPAPVGGPPGPRYHGNYSSGSGGSGMSEHYPGGPRPDEFYRYREYAYPRPYAPPPHMRPEYVGRMEYDDNRPDYRYYDYTKSRPGAFGRPPPPPPPSGVRGPPPSAGLPPAPAAAAGHGIPAQKAPTSPTSTKGQFTNAIYFVNKIKQRFANEPEKYKMFLDILQSYRKNQHLRLVNKQVTELIADSPDLLEEFKLFLPDNVPPPGAPVADRKKVAQPPPPPTSSTPGAVPRGPKALSVDATAPDARTALEARYVDDDLELLDEEAFGTAPISEMVPSFIKVHADYPAEEDDSVMLSLVKPDELSFFDKLRKHVGDRPTYVDFLRLLSLYTHDIVGLKTFMNLSMQFIGDSDDLISSLKELVQWDTVKEGPIEQDPFEPRIMNVPYTDRPLLDINAMPARGPSYRKLPSVEVQLACSGREPMDWLVLNDEWACLALWGTEGGGGAYRKSVYEEAMYTTEQERHWFSYHLDSMNRCIAHFSLLVERMKRIPARDHATTRLNANLDGPSPTIYMRIIEKVYGKDAAPEVINLLQMAPVTTVPRVLARILQKNEDWRSAALEWNKVWSEIEAKNSYRALDHQGLAFKANDKKVATSAKGLVSEIQQLHEDNTVKRVACASPSSHRPTYQMELGVSDFDVFLDACSLFLYHVYREGSPYSRAERLRIERLILHIIPAVFAPVQERPNVSGASAADATEDVPEAPTPAPFTPSADQHATVPLAVPQLPVDQFPGLLTAEIRKRHSKYEWSELRDDRIVVCSQNEPPAERGAEDTLSTWQADDMLRSVRPPKHSPRPRFTSWPSQSELHEQLQDIIARVSKVGPSNAKRPQEKEGDATNVIPEPAPDGPEDAPSAPARPGEPGSPEAPGSIGSPENAGSPVDANDDLSESEDTFDITPPETWINLVRLDENNLDSSTLFNAAIEEPRRYNMFADSNLYVVIRTLHTLYARLVSFKIATENVAKTPETRVNPIAFELGLVEPQPVIDSGPHAAKHYYSHMLRLAMRLVDEDIDQSLFEDQLRMMLPTEAYPLFSLDRLVIALAKAANTAQADSDTRRLVRLLLNDRQIPPEKVTLLHQIAYRMEAEALTENSQLFRIEFIPQTSSLAVQLMHPQDHTLDYNTNTQRHAAWLASFVLPAATEGIGAPVQPPFLIRNRNAAENQSLDDVFFAADLAVGVVPHQYRLQFMADTGAAMFHTKPASQRMDSSKGSSSDEEADNDAEDESQRAPEPAENARRIRSRRFENWLTSMLESPSTPTTEASDVSEE